MLDGFPVGWFAPTYKYLNEPWRDFLRILKPVTAKVSVQERRIELVTGGSLEFWSLEDPDAGRSRKYKHLTIDEAGKARNLKIAWNEAIRPTLADFKGTADLPGTPKGHNFFWECFTKGQDPGDDEWAAFQIPTSENPYIDPAEIEAARKGMPERAFRQEFLAEFIEDAGGVFRLVSEAIDRGRKENEPPRPGESYSMGVDLARVNDFTVLSVVDSRGRQVYFERFNQISWERQIGAITRVAKLYNATVYIDSTGVGDPIYEAIRKAGVNVSPYHFTNASKEALIDNLAMMIEQGKARLMDIPEQTNELLAFEYELTPTRKVRMSAPEGMHDDCVIGAALAYWGASKPIVTAASVGEPRVIPTGLPALY